MPAAPWRLVGIASRTCGAVTFPAPDGTPARDAQAKTCRPHRCRPAARCGPSPCNGSPRSRRTWQRTDFRPYSVGYVDLGGEVLVERARRRPGCFESASPWTLVIEAFTARRRVCRHVRVRHRTEDEADRVSANDVAIVGIGIHPFGRTEASAGSEQGAFAAAGRAGATPGIGWSDVQFAFGGSDAAGNADTLVADLGLTGLAVHQRGQRLRHRRQRAGDGRQRHPLRRLRPRHGDRLRQAPARRVRRRPGRSAASATGTARPG